MRRTLPILPTLALIGAARAQSFPAVPQGGTVYDGAQLLSSAQKATVNALSRDFQRDTGAPIVVATLPSLDAFGAKAVGIERYAGQLFDQWRIGSRAHNGGILLVVAKADRKARIELGKDWEHRYDAKAHMVMQSKILPAFKRGDYGGGIVQGCQALAHLADESPTQPTGQAALAGESALPLSPTPMDVQTASNGDTMTAIIVGFVLCCLAVPILVGVAIVRTLKRAGGMASPTSGFGSGSRDGGRTTYTRTPAAEDDAYAAGFAAGSMASPPIFVDPTPSYDPGPSFDASPSFDTSSSFDSGSSADTSTSSDSGSFDSGSSGGGGDSGSW